MYSGGLNFLLQHRFYGKSIPLGSMEKVMKSKTVRGYFNSAQALADYAEVLMHVKHKFSAKNAPIIVVGGSYGGSMYFSMLFFFFILEFCSRIFFSPFGGDISLNTST